MPARNGTGPNGEGPLTGGGFGPCGTGDERLTGTNFPYGRGFFRRGFNGRPFGRGRGRGIGFFAGRGFADDQPYEENEKEYLKSQASRLETALKDIQTRLNNLENDKG